MSTQNEPSADDLADAIEQAAQARHDAEVAALRVGSPLDASLKRGNPRQQHGGPTVWNVIDVMHTPMMAFDPAQVTTLEEFDELQGHGVSMAVDALKETHATVKRLCEARETLKANVIAHPAAQALELDDLAHKLTSAVSKKIDAAHATITKAIAAHEQTLSTQVKDSVHGAEIRGYVRSLPSSKRLTVLTQAITNNDAATVSALLGAPTRILTGLDLSDELHTAFIRQWNSKRDPLTSKRLALAQKAVEKLEAAGSSLLANMEKIVGVREKTIRDLRAQREKVRSAMGTAG